MAIIKSVRVGGTYNLENYENYRIEIEAELQDGDVLETVIAELKEKVDASVPPSYSTLNNTRRELQRQIRELQAQAQAQTQAQTLLQGQEHSASQSPLADDVDEDDDDDDEGYDADYYDITHDDDDPLSC